MAATFPVWNCIRFITRFGFTLKDHLPVLQWLWIVCNT